MDKRLSEINNLINNVKNVRTKQDVIPEDIKKKTIQKYPYLKSYKTITADKIKMGDVIRYLNLNLEKISIACIVVDITYVSSIDPQINNKKISKILLTNIDSKHKIFWSINPAKYYIFKNSRYKRSDKYDLFIENILNLGNNYKNNG